MARKLIDFRRRQVVLRPSGSCGGRRRQTQVDLDIGIQRCNLGPLLEADVVCSDSFRVVGASTSRALSSVVELHEEKVEPGVLNRRCKMGVRDDTLRCARDIILPSCGGEKSLELSDHVSVATALVVWNRIAVGIVWNRAIQVRFDIEVETINASFTERTRLARINPFFSLRTESAPKEVREVDGAGRVVDPVVDGIATADRQQNFLA